MLYLIYSRLWTLPCTSWCRFWHAKSNSNKVLCVSVIVMLIYLLARALHLHCLQGQNNHTVCRVPSERARRTNDVTMLGARWNVHVVLGAAVSTWRKAQLKCLFNWAWVRWFTSILLSSGRALLFFFWLAWQFGIDSFFKVFRNYDVGTI